MKYVLVMFFLLVQWISYGQYNFHLPYGNNLAKIYRITDTAEMYKNPLNVRIFIYVAPLTDTDTKCISDFLLNIDKFKKIEQIKLNCNLAKIDSIPDKFKNLKMLSCFDLSAIIKYPPISILNIPNLKCLHLDCSSIDFDKFQLNKLAYLEELSIRKTGNHFVNSILSLKKLKVLDYDDSGLDSIPPDIYKLTNLNYLTLYNNPIRIIPNNLSKLKNLHFINLRETKIKSIPTDIYKLKNVKLLISAGCDSDSYLTFKDVIRILDEKPDDWNVHFFDD